MVDDWRRTMQFDVGAVGTPTSTRWVRENSDGTRTIFVGTGFTFDAEGTPTAGAVTAILLVDPATSSQLQRIVNPGSGWLLTDLVALVIPYGEFRDIHIGPDWFDAIQAEGDDGEPTVTDTSIRFALADGTITEIIGTNFNAAWAAQNFDLATTTGVSRFQSDGTTLITESDFSSDPQSLTFLVRVLFDDELSRLVFDEFVVSGGVRVEALSAPPQGAWWGDYALAGGAGNDIFQGFVSSDPNFQGTGVSYENALAGVTVNMTTGRATGHGTDRLYDIRNVEGSSFADTINGNALNNELDGGGGNDVLRGLAGNDSLHGDDGDDRLNGGAGQDYLSGGLGNDILTGGANEDTFAFDTMAAATNRDRITDFSHADDFILLNASIYTGLAGWNEMTAAEQMDAFYVTGSGPRDAEDRLTYNPTNGTLTYDADGNGPGTGVVIVVLTNTPADLDHTDIGVFTV